MKYYIYTLCPTDFWAGFCPVKQFVKDSVKEASWWDGESATEAKAKARFEAEAWVKKMRRILFEAQTYWEGDIVTERVAALPSGDPDPVLIYVVKQSNNGTTFVVSPVPILHLDAQDYAEVATFDTKVLAQNPA